MAGVLMLGFLLDRLFGLFTHLAVGSAGNWQKWTDVQVTPELLTGLSADCDEFLIHAVDVEGKASGVEKELIRMLGDWEGIPVTYAGGVGSMEDLETIKEIGRGRVDVTIGSALDLFGGCIPYQNVVYLG